MVSIMKRPLLAIGLVICLVSATRLAVAHQYFLGFSDSLIELHKEGLSYQLCLGAAELSTAVAMDADFNGIISAEEFKASAPLVEEYIRKHLTVRINGLPVEPHFKFPEFRSHDPNEVIPDHLNLSLSAQYYFWYDISFPVPSPVRSLEVEYTIFSDVTPNFTGPARLLHNGRMIAFVFSPDNPILKTSLKSRQQEILTQAWNFFRFGNRHILTGYDHLLFLFSLLVISKRFRQVIGIVTAFTIAHSITLALAALHILALPSRLTESLIALTIAYVAAENIRNKLIAPRWVTTFSFGFIHGFGFASALAERGLQHSTLAISLASFNIGIEIGQIALVLAAWPILTFLARRHWQPRFTMIASSGVILLALYWFAQRAFLPTLPDFPPQFH